MSAEELPSAAQPGGPPLLVLARRGDTPLSGAACGIRHQVAFAPLSAKDLSARATWLFASAATQEQAQSLDEARLSTAGRVAAYVAHETRNALAYAYANARYVNDALRSRDRGAVDAGAQEDLAEAAADAEEGVARSLEASRTILELCRGQALESSAIDLNALIRATVSFLSGRGREKVRFELQLEELPAALGHEAGLKQVLTNLILNAMDAAGPAGKVQIRSQLQGDRLALCVADSGGGLSQAASRTLFTPFSTSKPGQGVGIGLTVCRSIVDSLGGHIEVLAHGALGGAEFRVLLPAASLQALG